MYKEDQNTELKETLTKDIKKEIIAFANTNKGTIYIGINDNGKIVGLNNSKEKLEALSGMIREGIKSDLTLYTKINIERIEDKDIIIVKIDDAPNKPYYLSERGLKPSGVYLRHGNTSVKANEETIKKMIVENSGDSFENNISSIQELNFEYFKNISKKLNIEIDENKFKTLNIKNLNNQYTNLGLLLSDECPYSIKCAIFDGNSKLEFKDRKEFTGSVIKQVNDTFDYLNLYNKTKGKIIGLERHDFKDYPEYAIRESLLNAVIHRDYNFTGSILVSLFDEHYEISSLGGLVKGLSMKDLYSGVSESRNPKLANVFYRLKFVESFGTGIERIIESYKDHDKKPQFLNTENTFKVTLYNNNYIEDKKNSSILIPNLTQEEQIKKYIKENGKINRITAEILLNISKSRTNEILNNMMKNGLIVKTGIGKNTHYILKP